MSYADRVRRRHSKEKGKWRLVILFVATPVLIAYVAAKSPENLWNVPLIVLGIFLYFLPLFVAISRGHHNTGSIAIINIFLGWTFLGWVIALAMAFSAVRD